MRKAKVVAALNFKGGVGKSTFTLHAGAAIARAGLRVAIIDLDAQNRTLIAASENRAAWARQNKSVLPPLVFRSFQYSAAPSIEARHAQDAAALAAAIDEFAGYNAVLLDCPSDGRWASRISLLHVDALVTPVSQSPLDLLSLSKFDALKGEAHGATEFTRAVWAAAQQRLELGQEPIDWIVTLNQYKPGAVFERLDALSRLRAVQQGLRKQGLSFRIERGLADRAIFQSLFTLGLTISDIDKQTLPPAERAPHAAARAEIANIIHAAGIPGLIKEKVA